jgi:AcrR family transcriptional regulator
VRYKTGHKEEARARMVAAAGRGFRRQGFGGIGVDGLAKEAEVTSGAFYGHFSSKGEAFKAALVAGLEARRQMGRRVHRFLSRTKAGLRARFELRLAEPDLGSAARR